MNPTRPTTKTRLKGGSLSGTYDCVGEDGSRFVRKEVSLSKNREYGFQRWYSQLKRMQRYSVLFPGYFPPLLRYGRDGELAYFDMDYIAHAVTVHDYLVSSPSPSDIDVMFDELVRMTDDMYRTEIASSPLPMDLYVYEEIEQKMLACRGNARFDAIAAFPTVELNGARCAGLAHVLPKLRELARATYTRSTESFSHGNLTLENILYVPNKSRIVMIDPYEENVIDSALADYSQILQSCDGRYELYNAATPSIHADRIECRIPQAAGLDYFRDKFFAFLDTRLTRDERLCVRLLEVSQFARMLPFKQEIAEDKMVFFYGLGSWLFEKVCRDIEGSR